MLQSRSDGACTCSTSCRDHCHSLAEGKRRTEHFPFCSWKQSLRRTQTSSRCNRDRGTIVRAGRLAVPRPCPVKDQQNPRRGMSESYEGLGFGLVTGWGRGSVARPCGRHAHAPFFPHATSLSPSPCLQLSRALSPAMCLRP